MDNILIYMVLFFLTSLETKREGSYKDNIILF